MGILRAAVSKTVVFGTVSLYQRPPLLVQLVVGESPFSDLDRSIYLDAKDEKYEREHKQQSQEQFGELESVVLALVFVLTT